MSVSNIPPASLIVTQLMAASQPKTSNPAPPPAAPAVSTQSQTVGTTSLFQQLSSGLQSFFLQLQSNNAYGGTAGQTATVAGAKHADSPTTLDSEGDDDAASGSSQSLGYTRRRSSATQETGAAEQSPADASDGLSSVSGLANASAATTPAGSANLASTFFAAIQAYAKTAGQTSVSSTPGRL